MRWLACVVVFVAATAAAQDVDVTRSGPRAVLAAIGDEVLYARYDEAIRDAHAFLARTDIDARDRNAGLERLAIAQIAQRSDADAHATLMTLYARDPQHRLDDPDASPRVQSAFARVRDSHPHLVDVRLEHTPQAPTTHEGPVVSVVVAVGSDAVQEVHLDFRSPGDTRFTRVVMAFDRGVARARVPIGGDATRPQTLDYFITAVAPSLAPLAHVGTDAVPLTVTVPPEAPRATTTRMTDDGHGATSTPEHTAQQDTTIMNETPWQVPHIGDGTAREGETRGAHSGSVTDEWWFWTLVGVVVLAGAGTALYFAVGPPSQPEPTGTLGAIILH